MHPVNRHADMHVNIAILGLVCVLRALKNNTTAEAAPAAPAIQVPEFTCSGKTDCRPFFT